MDGWNGKALWVDLATGRLETRIIDPKHLRSFIGGRGLNGWVLFNLVKPGIDPFGPENLLAFAVGPLTGTSLSSTSRVQVSTLSPLSGILGDGNAGGAFGLSMKRTGYDQFVFTGVSPKAPSSSSLTARRPGSWKLPTLSRRPLGKKPTG